MGLRDEVSDEAAASAVCPTPVPTHPKAASRGRPHKKGPGRPRQKGSQSPPRKASKASHKKALKPTASRRKREQDSAHDRPDASATAPSALGPSVPRTKRQLVPPEVPPASPLRSLPRGEAVHLLLQPVPVPLAYVQTRNTAVRRMIYFGTLWRLFPCGDPTVSIFFSRDLDDCLDANSRELIAEWEQDGALYAHRHAEEDRYLVNAGWFGLKHGAIPEGWSMKDNVVGWCLWCRLLSVSDSTFR